MSLQFKSVEVLLEISNLFCLTASISHEYEGVVSIVIHSIKELIAL